MSVKNCVWNRIQKWVRHPFRERMTARVEAQVWNRVMDHTDQVPPQTRVRTPALRKINR